MHQLFFSSHSYCPNRARNRVMNWTIPVSIWVHALYCITRFKSFLRMATAEELVNWCQNFGGNWRGGGATYAVKSRRARGHCGRYFFMHVGGVLFFHCQRFSQTLWQLVLFMQLLFRVTRPQTLVKQDFRQIAGKVYLIILWIICLDYYLHKICRSVTFHYISPKIETFYHCIHCGNTINVEWHDFMTNFPLS